MILVVARHLCNDPGICSPLQGKHFSHALANTLRGGIVIALEKAGQLLESLLTFVGSLHLPGGPHQIQSLPLLVFGYSDHIAKFVVPTSLDRLLGAENFVNGSSQRFGAVDDE